MHTLRHLFAATVCCALAIAPVWAQADSAAIGIIAKADGQAFIERGSEKIAARMADLLYPGDKIAIAAGQVAFLFCPSSDRITILDGALVELNPAGIRVLKGKAPVKSPAKCIMPRVVLGRESMERMGGLRARGELPISLYVGGTISSQRPTFRWAPVEGAQSYHLALRDATRDTTVWETTTAASSIAYPEFLPALEKTQYEWEVRAVAKEKILARGSVFLEVKPDNIGQIVADTGPDSKLLRAISFENEGYYAEAAALFREMRDATPGDARLTRHLAWLYWNAGLVVAANEELRRLAAKPE